ncbi:MAG: glycerol-3-phosphate 1-O-acyltransferase PlsY [Lachnospiraceae bacterium]|nr:glycerol-3-phosphate 1-O-acyltransferase PlsY [Lachnospiraceae bacterium]
MQRIICLLLGYALGLIQTGYLVGRAKGIDIREYGSKNAGTTNVLRTMGSKYGALVLLGDALKCVAAALITKLIFISSCPEIICLLMLYAAAGVILGHNFPFYMNFKGGKGIAASAGLALSYSFQVEHGWIIILVGVIVFFSIFFTTHYVSISSISAYISVCVCAIIMGQLGAYDFPSASNRALLTEYYAVMILLTLMAIIRHKENIKRLIAGTERKTYIKGKPEIDVKNIDKNE